MNKDNKTLDKMDPGGDSDLNEELESNNELLPGQWVDPAGGIHEEGEEDPAAMYE